MQAQDVFVECSQKLSDPARVRFQNPILFRALGDALDEMWARRRSAFYTAGIVMVMPAKPTGLTDTVFVQDQYRLALALYMAYLCLIDPNPATTNPKLAQMYYDSFDKAMGG